jgi:hypothetical protein
MSRQADHCKRLAQLSAIRRVQRDAAEHRLALADLALRHRQDDQGAAEAELTSSERLWAARASGGSLDLRLMQAFAVQVLEREAALQASTAEVERASEHRLACAGDWRNADAREQLTRPAAAQSRRRLARQMEENSLAQVEEMALARRLR